MKRDNIIIGSRGSKLAIIYAEKVKSEISKFYSGKIKIRKIITSGDQNQNERLSSMGGKGMFSTDIEKELLENKIDIAVHALKDMPSADTIGLTTNCFLKRNSPNEILISKNLKFNELKQGSVIGTSSFRREYQLRNVRADLVYKLIRGNVDTRIKKLENDEYDAIILSKAGIDSLNLQNKITDEFDVSKLVPCAGQGIIAIQCNENNPDILRLIEKINDKQTRIIANTEREVLKILEGDCDTAIGVFATIENNKIELTAELFSVDGKSRFFIKEDDDIENHMILAKKIAGDLKIKSKGSYKG
ncbi:hydroxymethylbilane synthase [Candidatus Pelagibacter sp. RS40]|uniref:hydroxymethylbilane synthase n=1 Tax=Candidatus Pelagibacter sp. RS40 TaxID=1977865 RepID=UPI000A147CFE|nr:hydroxymethylbilane synthase [Candidatus Pelagibacter sp. RS40]ARJ49016.1 hydroxymethylbilane synthase [Candidatus Pelagibacter sp. RS40]